MLRAGELRSSQTDRKSMHLRSHATKAVVLDIDGTLAREDHAVSDAGYRALAALESAGLRTILLTGRSESAALTVATRGGLTSPVISCSGAVVTDPVTGSRLDVRTIRESDVLETLAFAEANDLQPFLFYADSQWSDRESSATRTVSAINGDPVEVSRHPKSLSGIVKIMLSAEAFRLDALSAELAGTTPQLHRTLPELVESSAPGADKWDTLARVLDQIGVRPSEALGFGDADADAEWMSHIGFAIAVENASQRVLDSAALVVGHHRDDAVARFLLRWLSERAATTSHAITSRAESTPASR